MAAYYVWSGATGSGNGSSWANAFTTLTAAFVTEAAGDTLHVAHDHSEATGSAVTLTASGTIDVPTKVVCVNRAGSVPPVSADRRATAQVATTGNFGITFGSGTVHYDGIIFVAGNSTGIASLNLTFAAACGRFDNCSLRLGGTSISSRINVGQSTGGNYVEFNNTTVSFGNASQTMIVGGVLKWRNTPAALLGVIPNAVIQGAAGWGGEIDCVGVDFSASGSGKTIVNGAAVSVAAKFRLVDCKLNAAVAKSSPLPSYPGATEVDFIRSSASGVNYTISRYRTAGTLDDETTIVRTGGALDGTTPIAWKIVTTIYCHYSVPFECPPIMNWNDTVGTPVTATVEGIWGGGVVPNDDECWLELEYLGSAASPQGSFVNDGKADLLAVAAPQANSTATWGGSTTKFKLGVTFTAQQAGRVYARVKCAKPATTFYIDAMVTLS